MVFSALGILAKIGRQEGGHMAGSGQGGEGVTGSVDFSALILGFSSAALYYMGECGIDSQQPPVEKNLPLAKQNIDIIAMLKDKTKGNLSADETKLIAQLVADLQVKMVDALKR